MTSEPDRQPHPRRLASAVKRRRQRLGLTRKQVAAAGGISQRSLSYVESGDANHGPRQATLDGLDRALLWMPGSARHVYEGTGRARARPRDVPRDAPLEMQVVMRAGLPRPMEAPLLSHLASRRQDMEAALEAEAMMLVGQFGVQLDIRAAMRDQDGAL